ncbi:MAG TPA: hypothetical protein VHW02_06650 [Rhizomicrobium sp.]|nr:hypothetical protein [Rhizomicrobium sp.]
MAAITYEPLARTDLTHFSDARYPKRWSELAPNQKSSLGHVAFHMAGGDLIYVKDHQNIINRGIIAGGLGTRAYRFDQRFSIKDPNGNAWSHQVPVNWLSDIQPKRLLLNAEMTTVLKLDLPRIEMIEQTFDQTEPPALGNEAEAQLCEDGYFRETIQNLRFISVLHKKMSNDFRRWLKENFSIDASPERNQIDIQFYHDDTKILAELKICYGAKTRHAIREALGQVFEYNYYPKRSIFDVWLIILDKTPSPEDKLYIDGLRENRHLPIHLGWMSERGFLFHPVWP